MHSHPLHLFSHCPRCGGEFAINDARSKRCVDCGFTYYLNASAAVAAFIVNDQGELLVAQRAKEPARGTLDLPGGFVDPGEALETALMREVKEETGALLQSASYLFSLPNVYLYSDFEVHTTDAFFLCSIDQDSPLRSADEVESLQWIAPHDIHADDFGLQSIRRAIRYFLQMPHNVSKPA